MLVYKYIIFSLTVLLLSCSSEDYNTGYDSKLVVHAHFNSSMPAEIYLTSSSEVLKNNVEVYPLNNADVGLYKSDFDYYNMVNSGFGKYISDYIPESGKSYTITASCPGFDPIESEVIMPKMVDLTDFSYETSYKYIDTMYNYYNDTIIIPIVVKDTLLETIISIKFKDFQEKGNFYRLCIRKQDSVIINDEMVSFFKPIGHGGINFNPTLDWVGFYGLPYQYLFFSDELNNGEEFEIKVKFAENSYAKFPIKYLICFEHLSDQTIAYYTDLANYYRSYSGLPSLDNTMNVDIMKTDDVPNYVPYISNSYVKGGYGAITAGSGFSEIIYYETKPLSK